MKTRLEYIYGLTIEEFEAQRDAQDNNCAICNKSFTVVSPQVDHDHRTGKTRGLLCASCNHGLGYFLDDPDRIQAAIKYLKEYNG